MPTYEYRCKACGHLFEEFQMYSEAVLRKCPECKKNKLERLFGTGGGIIFKGSGFYETDYRSESYTKAAKADQEASKPAAADKDAKTDKPAATTDAGGKADKPATASKPADAGGKSEAKSSKSKK